MLLAAQILAVVLASLLVGQALLVLGMIPKLCAASPPLLPDDRCPAAAIVLCLRGADPSLTDCLLAIGRQDYPNYDVRLVVDSQSDPAWQIAKTIASELPRQIFYLEPLEERRTTCSLKCSALLQAIGRLEDR